MKLIKNAIVYKAELPGAELLRQHLAERPFSEIMELEASTSGFVPITATDELVSEFEGGLAFAFRLDEKILPAAAVRTELEKRCQKIEEQQGYKPGRKQTREIREQVIDDLIKRALVKSSTITCFYDTANQYLIVPVTSKSLADQITSTLIHSVGSLKTQTIHISDIKHGLTTRLVAWLDGEENAFGALEPCDTIGLQRDTERVRVKLGALETAEKGLREAISAQFEVTEIGFQAGPVGFRLTRDFHFKGITYEHQVDVMDRNHEEQWAHEAAIQMLELSNVITGLCDLLGYKPPVEDQQAA